MEGKAPPVHDSGPSDSKLRNLRQKAKSGVFFWLVLSVGKASVPPVVICVSTSRGRQRFKFNFNLLTFFCSVEKQGLYLVEAKLLVEEKLMIRGHWFSYRFGVKHRQKHIIEFALRHILIPSNQNIKGKTR